MGYLSTSFSKMYSHICIAFFCLRYPTTANSH